MKIYQLPSGAYNIRKMINGQRISITFDHKPGKKEIDQAIFEAKENMKDKPPEIKDTFLKAAEEYLEIKSEVLSPTTIKNYKSILRNLPDTFLAAKMADIDQIMIQRVINTYSANRSPKSVKNASGFITVVMWMYRPEMVIKTKLPQKEKVETYIPTDKEVKMLLQAIKGSEYEPVIMLCLLGLRKSEAIAVKASDIKGNILTIDSALVVNEDGEYIEKTTKTTSSTREIWLPDYLVKMIKKRGQAYTGFPGNILRYLHRTQDALGIPRCKLHALRHYYVSHAHELGIPDAAIAAAVGHVNTNTTRAIYLHAQNEKQTKREKKAAKFLEV